MLKQKENIRSRIEMVIVVFVSGLAFAEGFFWKRSENSEIDFDQRYYAGREDTNRSAVSLGSLRQRLRVLFRL